MSLNVIESVIVEDGRIHEVWKRAYSVLCQNEGTWCALFKTKGYQRRSRHFNALALHGHWLIERELRAAGPNWRA